MLCINALIATWWTFRVLGLFPGTLSKYAPRSFIKSLNTSIFKFIFPKLESVSRSTTIGPPNRVVSVFTLF